MIQQFIQPDIEIHDENTNLQTTQMIPSTCVPSQQIARPEFSIAAQFVFHVITERQKKHLLRMLSVLLKKSETNRQILFFLKNTAFIFMQFI